MPEPTPKGNAAASQLKRPRKGGHGSSSPAQGTRRTSALLTARAIAAIGGNRPPKKKRSRGLGLGGEGCWGAKGVGASPEGKAPEWPRGSELG
eukprot:14888256-Alexandrium_andersonii.AAC.1